MKLVSILSICALAAAAAGCSKGPVPPVAQAYADQYGAVETSLLTHCPKVQGVWQLSNLSAGAFLNADGETIQHFRWYMPKLFGLSTNTKSYVAIAPDTLETVLYVSNTIPRTGGRNWLGYTTKSDNEIPCVGHGWRIAGVTDHSQNDAAARVLGLVPELPKKITQTEYFAKTAANELLLAIRIEYEGTKAKSKDKEPVNEGYWHFLKMPRLYESPKEQGFKS
jgi:hypothetical protein